MAQSNKMVKKILLSSFIFIFFTELICYFFILPIFIKKIQAFDSKVCVETFYGLGGRVDADPSSKNNAKVPHPYFGYIREVPTFETINQLKNRNPDSIRIGIFGGSVAETFAAYLIETKQLQKQIMNLPFFKDKNIEIIPFATGGHRQPSALSISTLLGHTIDFSINIEGNNEIKSNIGGLFPIYYPEDSISSIYYAGIENFSRITEGLNNERKIRKIKKWTSYRWLPNSIQSYFLALLIYRQNKATIWMNEHIFKMKPFYENESAPKIEDFAAFWAKSSCQQQNILADLKIPSLYFIQPLPFIYNNKFMTPHELELLKEHNSAESISEFNSAMTYTIDLMKKSGLHFYDFSRVFKDQHQELYIDGCCHLNSKGNELLANNIAAVIKSFTQKPKLKRCSLEVFK